MTLLSISLAMVPAAIAAWLLVVYFEWRRTVTGRVLERHEAKPIDQAA
jgi:hypothetical protein